MEDGSASADTEAPPPSPAQSPGDRAGAPADADAANPGTGARPGPAAADATAPGASCPVCMEPVGAGAATTLRCGHTVCSSCLFQLRRPVCPICRQGLFPHIEFYDSEEGEDQLLVELLAAEAPRRRAGRGGRRRPLPRTPPRGRGPRSPPAGCCPTLRFF